MKKKNPDKQHHGALSSISGYRYEVVFFVQKLVELLLQNPLESKIISVTRTKKDTYVDDVYVKTKGGDTFYQCKGYAHYGKELFTDLLSQFERNKNSSIYLITQKKDKWYAELAQDAKKFEFGEFLNNLNTDSQRLKHKQQFESLLVYIGGSADVNQQRRYLYEFLRHFSIIAQDDIDTERTIKEKLTEYGYPLVDAEKIYSKLYTQADNYNWQSTTITIDILKQELNIIGVQYLSKEMLMQVSDKPVPQKLEKKKTIHILQNPAVQFYEKLSYLLDLIANLQKPREQERNQSLEIISKDSTLAWHFFRNLKDINWFPKIQNGLIKAVIEQGQDTAVKYQLLHYFELCAERYSNEIIPLLIEFENNTINPNILSAWIRTLSKLKPGKKTKLDSIWKILNKLAEHQHPWVRKEIPDTLKILAEYDLDKSLKILEKLFLSSPIPRNVTQGSPTLALTFQGGDNENWVFEQSAHVLAGLMVDPRYTEKVIKFACKLEIFFIKQEKERKAMAGGITLDYSYIWLGDRDPLNRLEYEYNRKKRIALELEKFLMDIAPNEIDRTREILSQLLQNKYEVFYLISINVLIQNTRKYLSTVESVVFNKGLWGNYNIQNYFLQRLLQNYFELDQSRLNEFIKTALAMSDDEKKEKEAYCKQDLLVSIPERFRTKEVNNALLSLEKKLRVPAKIEPIFKITSWSGPQPDTTTKELKVKTPDELVDIMEEATTRKRKADPYDLAPLFAALVRETPDLIHQLLERLPSRNIAPDFFAHMVRVYIEVKNKNWEEILNVFWKLDKKQGWARMEVARFLEKECRKESIQSIDSDLLNKIKQALFDLAEDEDPNDDGTMPSSHPTPEDAITRGINSIRGVATEALVVLLFYYPDDSDIEKKVKAFAEDKTISIKATLLYNLRCLTGKKYDFCDAIVKKFIDIRKPEIDFALIHYFASLDPKKFKSNESFIKLIFNDPHEKIQSLLGELIGGRYLSDFPIKPLLDSILKGAIGEIDARRSIAFIFESNLETIIGTNKQKQILDYMKQLADPQREPDHSIRERSTFFFARSGTRSDHFMVFYKNHIFDAIIKDAMNISSQNYLIEYLERCVYANQSIEKCLEVLHRQTITVEGVWTDQLIAQRIAAILRKLYENSNLKKNLKKKVDEIFDKGLQRGWDEFYKLFEDFKTNRSNS